MSPMVHERLQRIERRLEEIEVNIIDIDKIRHEPFMSDTLKSPKSRTEWLFSWNDTLRDLLKDKKVYSINIPTEAKRQTYLDYVYKQVLSLPPGLYRYLYESALKQIEPVQYNAMKLKLVNLEDYFPMQTIHY
jgi:hypothetical protein